MPADYDCLMMPRTTQAELQADILSLAEQLLTASLLLEADDWDAYLLGAEEDEEFKADNDVSELLDLTALNWLEIAQAISGDGSCGTYDRIPKFTDFFSVCLQAPDHEFQHVFRYPI
jgi:hypothetical protein